MEFWPKLAVNGVQNCKKASDEYKHKKEQDIDEANLKNYKNEKNKFNR